MPPVLKAGKVSNSLLPRNTVSHLPADTAHDQLEEHEWEPTVLLTRPVHSNQASAGAKEWVWFTETPTEDPQGQKRSCKNPVGMSSPEVPHPASWKERAVFAAGKGSQRYWTDVVADRLFLFGSFGKEAFPLYMSVVPYKGGFHVLD